MTFMGKLVALFPPLHGLAILFATVRFIQEVSLLTFMLMPLAIYVFPLVCFRIHNFLYPTVAGEYDLSSKNYSPWWGSYQFQWMFNTFTAFEKILLMYPPLFGSWLRLWGAEIGDNILFTPKLEILDRPLLKIGSNTTFGYEVKITSHYVTPKNGRPMLSVAVPEIGEKCFIGAFSRIGPGAVIKEGVRIPYNFEAWPLEVINRSPSMYPKPEREYGKSSVLSYQTLKPEDLSEGEGNRES